MFFKNEKHNKCNKKKETAAKEQRKDISMKLEKIEKQTSFANMKLVMDDENFLLLENTWDPLMRIEEMHYDSVENLYKMLNSLEEESRRIGKTRLQVGSNEFTKEDGTNLYKYGFHIKYLTEKCLYAELDL